MLGEKKIIILEEKMIIVLKRGKQIPKMVKIINQRVEYQHESKDSRVLTDNNQGRILGTDDDNDENYHF